MDTARQKKGIAKRIKDLMEEKSIKGVDITKKIGASSGVISQWRNPEISTRPSGDCLLSLAKLLDSTPDYILYGTGKGDNYQNKDTLSRIFIIDYIEAGSWGEITDPYELRDGHDSILSDCSGDSCFALQVKGHSMTAPVGSPDSFPENTIIHVNPDITPQNGNFVIAKEEGEERATFKQLKYNEQKPYLSALNPDSNLYPPITNNFNIIGVVYASNKTHI